MSAAIDTRALKDAVSLPRLIAETIKLHSERRLFAGLCPFHGEKTPSFYVWPDHYHCFGCGAHGDAIAWLMHARDMSFKEAAAFLSGETNSTRTFQPVDKPRPSNDDPKPTIEFARRIWKECVPPAGTLVEDYLTYRKLSLPDQPVIRFHPACPCGPKDKMPAMVALMSNPVTGNPRGIHRTFLRPDGKGKVSKMMLGQAGVIRLCERITNGLGLAEGIETALAVAQRVGWGPVWAAGSAEGIRKFPVLPQTTLSIFADHDQSGVGITAARECAQRWAANGRECLIYLPREGADWDEATLGEDVP